MAILREKLGVPGAVPDSLDAHYCADDLAPDLLSDGQSGSPWRKGLSDTMLGRETGTAGTPGVPAFVNPGAWQ